MGWHGPQSGDCTCCDCDVEGNCVPIRDAGKLWCDDLLLEIPTGLEDTADCGDDPGDCESGITDTHTLSAVTPPSPCDTIASLGGIYAWEKLTQTFEIPCACDEEEPEIDSLLEVSYEITQECVGTSCIVLVVIDADLECHPPTVFGQQEWRYQVAGPIDVSDGPFEVPFLSAIDTDGTPCLADAYPDSVFIKEVP